MATTMPLVTIPMSELPEIATLNHYYQDTFFEKLSQQFACETDTTVGHYRWFG